MKTEGLREAVEWLKKLSREVLIYRHLARPLTDEEWQKAQELIHEFELPCVLRLTGYGFDLVIYPHAEIKGQKPYEILSVDDSNFPFSSAKKGWDGQEETLQILSAITHTPRNTELLSWYGFEPLRELDHYIY